MSEEKERVVLAFYIGRRVATGNKLAHFWQFYGEDKPRGFIKQLAPATIGEVWAVTVTDDNKHYVGGPKGPKRAEVQKTHDRKQVHEWVALDAAAYADNQTRLAEKKLAKRRTEFDRALEPLRNLVVACPTHEQRAFLINAIVSELWRRA